MKKVVSLILAVLMLAALCVSFASCGGSNQKYTIGICQLVTHDALDAATQGFKDAVEKGLGKDNVEFIFQNAANDSNTCTTIVASFVSKDVDLIMANATPALQAAYNATDKIPILGTSITEYGVALGLDNFNGTVGSNVSGTSDLAPLTEQADALIELFPEAKNVGLLYCSAEPNSEYQVKVIEEYLATKNITTSRFSFSDSNDVRTVTENAASQSDVIYIPTDNTAASCTEVIDSVIRQKNVPVFAGESGICSGCGVATLSIDYYDLGYKTGEMAVEILKNGKDIRTMAIEYAPATKKYNAEMCEYFNITVPEGYVALGE